MLFIALSQDDLWDSWSRFKLVELDSTTTLKNAMTLRPPAPRIEIDPSFASFAACRMNQYADARDSGMLVAPGFRLWSKHLVRRCERQELGAGDPRRGPGERSVTPRLKLKGNSRKALSSL